MLPLLRLIIGDSNREKKIMDHSNQILQNFATLEKFRKSKAFFESRYYDLNSFMEMAPLG